VVSVLSTFFAAQPDWQMHSAKAINAEAKFFRNFSVIAQN
jgi:hypothetical protein